MSRLITLNDVIKTISDQFRDGPPNGWLLGWDQSRFFAAVKTAAIPYLTTNHTTFDYGFCNWYEVRIDSDTNHRYWVLTIKLSFIVPTYCVHWTQYERPMQGVFISAAPACCQSVEEKIRVALEDMSFFELPDEWYKQEVQGVELELSGSENVTVGKCLFSDYAE